MQLVNYYFVCVSVCVCVCACVYMCMHVRTYVCMHYMHAFCVEFPHCKVGLPSSTFRLSGANKQLLVPQFMWCWKAVAVLRGQFYGMLQHAGSRRIQHLWSYGWCCKLPDVYKYVIFNAAHLWILH